VSDKVRSLAPARDSAAVRRENGVSESTSEGSRSRRRGGAKAVRGGLAVLGRVIAAIFSVLALIVVLAIVLKVLEANRENFIVASLIGAGDFLVGPFRQVFTFGSRSTEVAVNFGIAAALYLVVGGVIGRILAR
jgi:uncharacterized membrane protein